MRTPLAVKRAGKRARLVLPAKLLTASGAYDIRLKDLSRAGALGEAATPPLEGDEVVVAFGPISIPARIAWVVGRRFGLEFHMPIGEDDIDALVGARKLS